MVMDLLIRWNFPLDVPSLLPKSVSLRPSKKSKAFLFLYERRVVTGIVRCLKIFGGVHVLKKLISCIVAGVFLLGIMAVPVGNAAAATPGNTLVSDSSYFHRRYVPGGGQGGYSPRAGG